MLAQARAFCLRGVEGAVTYEQIGRAATELKEPKNQRGDSVERVSIHLDVANLEAAFRKCGFDPDFVGLRDYLAAGRTVVEAYAYIPVSPYQPEARASLIRFLQRNGFLVRSKMGRKRPSGRWKCDMDCDLGCDVLRTVHLRCADIVVVGCGDGDLKPVYREARRYGVRVEVACTRERVARDMLEAASSFIDLTPIILHEGNRDGRNEGTNGDLGRVSRL